MTDRPPPKEPWTPAEPPPPPRRPPRFDGLAGVVLAFILLATFAVIAAGAFELLGRAFGRGPVEAVAAYWAVGIGLWQWLYLAPLSAWLRRSGRWELGEGLLVGGALILLLNGLCWKAGCRVGSI